MNNFLLFKILTFFFTLPGTFPHTCKQRRKIILDVNRGGFGNRLLGLTSTAMLAVLLDRSLFLNWKDKPNCGARFTDLFVTDRNPEKNGVFFPLNVSDSDIFPPDKEPNHEHLEHYECHIVLENRDDFQHFQLLWDRKLFQKLDQECEVIHIQTNQYFSPLLFELGYIYIYICM